MKVEDLMLGDWVQGFVPDSYSTIYGIFNEQRIAIIAEPSKAYIELSIDDIHPIPITPEILEKNGFENDFYETESVADYVAIQIEGYSLRCKSRGCDFDSALVKWCNGRCDIVTDDDYEVRGAMIYVHQLQHALRLCGISLDLKI